MPHIRVTSEQLGELSRQMSQSATQLYNLEGQPGRALSRLDWETHQQANVEGQVNTVRQQARRLVGKTYAENNSRGFCSLESICYSLSNLLGGQQ